MRCVRRRFDSNEKGDVRRVMRPPVVEDSDASGQRKTRGLIVLESTNAPDGSTRYIDQVVSHASDEVEFRYLSVSNLMKPCDVFHVHWPDAIIRGRFRAETYLRCTFFKLALIVMQRRRTAIVRTLHNVQPHEKVDSAIERRTLTYLDDVTDLFVTINPLTNAPHEPQILIPHGHYRSRFADIPRQAMVPGRVLYAGLIRPYKGVEQLITVFGEIPMPMTLRLVGKPTELLREKIQAATARSMQITARLEFVADADLVREVSASEIVCLPYNEMHNSGMMLVALSLDRPVIVPNTPTTRIVAEEVGAGWVHLYDGDLAPASIMQAIEEARAHQSRPRPRLDNRDWEMIGEQYSTAFAQAATNKKRQPRD